jgi:hypothetical protein
MNASDFHGFIKLFKSTYPNHFIHERKGHDVIFWDAPLEPIDQSHFIAIWMYGLYLVSFGFSNEYCHFHGLDIAKPVYFETYRLEIHSWTRSANLKGFH